jgi:hypothetical protein
MAANKLGSNSGEGGAKIDVDALRSFRHRSANVAAQANQIMAEFGGMKEM